MWYSTTTEGEHAVLQRSTRLSSDDLGELLLTVLAQRQPQALWFDEGQHLIKVAGARGPLDQLDVLKSLANRSCIPTVLFGTYEMNVLLGLVRRLDRRMFRIHIPRYHATQPADVAAFQQVLFGLQKHLPFPEYDNSGRGLGVFLHWVTGLCRYPEGLAVPGSKRSLRHERAGKYTLAQHVREMGKGS